MRALAILSLLATAAAPPSLEPGFWTNGEDRYFTGEAGKPQPDWLGIEVGEDSRWRPVDAYGSPLGEWRTGTPPALDMRADGTTWVGSSLGTATEIRRANPFRCWMSVKKFAAKPDGSDDWDFHSGLLLHDQDGRAKAGGEGSPETIFRMRRVVWPAPSTNKPSLVLYVHRPDAPDKAVSYTWANPEATLIGINLRWVQGSCSQVEEPSDTASLEADRAALVAAGETWNARLAAADWDGIRALYEPDAWLMTDRAPALTSVDAIVHYLKRSADSGAKVAFRFEPEDVRVERPYGFVTAKYWMTVQVPGRTEPVRSAGRSLLVYKWRDGAWRLWRDMDNTTPDVPVAD